MAYLEPEALAALGLAKLGHNVRISSRAVLYDPHLIEIGDNTRIDDFCVVSGRVTLGRNVLLTVYCNVAGGRTGVVIDDFSTLAYGCQVFAQSEDYSGRFLSNSTVPLAFRRETCKPVHLARHCIVGANSVVVPGVTLSEGTAVYAMSLVTKTTLPWSIYFGVPARRLKARHRDLLDLEQSYLAGHGGDCRDMDVLEDARARSRNDGG
ncbi:galactoside O-acetyltransferase [Tistlia consotensis]|uniref:Galactoside O-acetyltransferase n=2 Tax=Tistlia TaxID=1321364 RepID=A0A1Y6CLL6_9PROT|nr:acyltransferase [Tistlia consotensis]SMF71488.1 galactoside O-acetyltransferase [Tistlia consotensis USBA 355]SNS06588.1 galactoside O-acetyltransferase [Tistlia consotensis]